MQHIFANTPTIDNCITPWFFRPEVKQNNIKEQGKTQLAKAQSSTTTLSHSTSMKEL